MLTVGAECLHVGRLHPANISIPPADLLTWDNWLSGKLLVREALDSIHRTNLTRLTVLGTVSSRNRTTSEAWSIRPRSGMFCDTEKTSMKIFHLT